MAYVLSLADVFVLLFVTLGPPLKVPALYMQATASMPEAQARALALRSFLFAIGTGLVGGFVGRYMMGSWHIGTSAMMLAAGLVFLLISLRGLLSQYQDAVPVVDHTESQNKTAYKIAVPMLVTPYGMAAIIVLLASSTTQQRTLWIVGLLVLVMVLNLLAMIFARQIMRTIGPIPLQVLGVIIGIMTVALSVQIMFGALHQLGIVTPSIP